MSALAVSLGVSERELMSQRLEDIFPHVDGKFFSMLDQNLGCNALCLNYKGVAKAVLGNDGKIATKIVIQACHAGVTIDYVSLKLFALLLRRKVNLDLITFAYHQLQGVSLHPCATSRLTLAGVDSLLRHYPVKRVLKLLFSDSSSLLPDTFSMFAELSRHGVTPSLPKKPQSLIAVHDTVSRAASRIGQDDFSLNQRADIAILDDTHLMDGLVVRVPLTHFDLVSLGEALNFCIGNGYYSREVAKGVFSIVGVFDAKGKAVYGVQFSRYDIQQAHGFGNQSEHKPSPSVIRSLSELLTKAPKMPEDFLPILDSHWIKGYKYSDGGDLYLLMGRTVYLYSGVPCSVYEALLDSEAKGRFVNRHVKKHYPYSKVGVL